MVKEIEIYSGKKIEINFTEIERNICNAFIVFLFIIFILMPNFEKIFGLEFRNFLLIIVSFITMIVVIAVKVLAGNFKLNKYTILLITYLILILLSYFCSEYRSGAFFGTRGRGEGVIPLICYMICFCITYNGFKYNSNIFNYITCAVVISSGYGVFQAILSDEYPSLCMYPYMGQSNFGNPNTFSSFLMIFFPIYIVKYYVIKEKGWLSVLTLIFSAIIGSKTFVGWITAIMVFFVYTIYFMIIYRNKKQIGIKFIVLLIFFISIFILFNLINDFAYVDEILENNQELLAIEMNNKQCHTYGNLNAILESNQEKNMFKGNNHAVNEFGNDRGFIWLMSIKIISDNPLLGVGPDSFGVEVKTNYMEKEDYALGKDYVDKAHSEYLQIAATTGIPSLIIYVIFLFTILISLLIKYIVYVKNGQVLEHKTMLLVAVTGSIVAYMIQAATNISIFAVTPLFWAMLGIGAKIASDNV